MKTPGLHPAAAAVRPAQQGLHGGDAVVGQADLRLEPHLQPALLEVAPQLRQQVQPLPCVFGHRRRIGQRLRAIAALGALQGDVGVAQRREAVGAVAEVAEPEGDAHRDRVLAAGEWQREQRQQRVRVETLHLAHHGEHIGTQRAQRGVDTEVFAQAMPNRREQQVAGFLAQAVVEIGEVVDVGEHQSQVGAASDAMQLAQQAGPVQQASEWVAERQPVHFLEMLQVAEAGREVGGEHLEQLVVHLVERRRGGDIDRRLALAGREEQHAVVFTMSVAALAQRAGDGGDDPFVLQIGKRLPHRGRKRADRTDHVEAIVIRVDRRAALCADDAVDGAAQQGLGLGQHALGEARQRLRLQQVARGAHDQLEAAAALVDGADLLVAFHRRGDGGDQAGAREFGLGEVVVDVVAGEHAELRRVAGLAGAQHDAGRGELALVADEVDQQQAGVLGFHHHVEQDDGGHVELRQLRAGFGRGVQVHEVQRPAVHLHVAQREARGLMHLRVVVHHHHAPAAAFLAGRVVRFAGEADPFVAHSRRSFMSAGAVAGRSTTKHVPRPSQSVSRMVPPSRPCTSV